MERKYKIPWWPYRFKMISDSHVSFTSSKISKSLSILSRLRNFVHKLCCLTCIDLLFKLSCPTGLQSEAKLLNWVWKRCWLCKNGLNILPLHLTYFKTICSLMHDFVNDQVPPNISDLFSYSSEKHHHYTRSSAAGNLSLKYSRTK